MLGSFAVYYGAFPDLYATILAFPVDFRIPTEKILSFHRPMHLRLLPEKGKIKFGGVSENGNVGNKVLEREQGLCPKNKNHVLCTWMIIVFGTIFLILCFRENFADKNAGGFPRPIRFLQSCRRAVQGHRL